MYQQMSKKTESKSTTLEREARRIFDEGGKLRAKHLPVLTGFARTKLESLLREGGGPPYFQVAPGCVRIFDSTDVRNWILSKRKGNI